MYHAWLPNIGAVLPPCGIEDVGFTRCPQDGNALELLLPVLPELKDSETPLEVYVRDINFYKARNGRGGRQGDRIHLVYLVCHPLDGPRHLFLSDQLPLKPRKLKKKTIDEIIALATELVGSMQIIGKIDDTSGIFQFKVELQGGYATRPNLTNSEIEEAKDRIGSQLFRVLRRCYHKHIWSASDLILEPVKGCYSKTQAADAIWQNSFHQRVFVDTTHQLKQAYFSVWRADERYWAPHKEKCASSLGELIYGEALAQQTSTPDQIGEACERGRQTYHNIWNLITAKQTGLSQRWTLWSMVFAFVALDAALLSLFIELLGGLPKTLWQQIGFYSIALSGLALLLWLLSSIIMAWSNKRVPGRYRSKTTWRKNGHR